MKKLIIISVFAVVSRAFEHDSTNCEQKDPESNICGRYPPFCKRSCYRSYDGSCNNLENPQWGSAYSAYQRFLDNSYSDGKHFLPSINLILNKSLHKVTTKTLQSHKRFVSVVNQLHEVVIDCIKLRLIDFCISCMVERNMYPCFGSPLNKKLGVVQPKLELVSQWSWLKTTSPIPGTLQFSALQDLWFDPCQLWCVDSQSLDDFILCILIIMYFMIY